MHRNAAGQQSKIQDPSFTAGDLRAGQRVLGVAESGLRVAVLAARTEGWSWDRIGAVLGLPGETSRRRWGKVPPDVKRPTTPPEAQGSSLP
uniref:Uncharacterized protein n=1 Tax=uncultured prokaryote TaxID=198431 RepID=A0A0H5Q3F2_9ZZZZ|nr:hypothetical protein [uncultured prokaryote]